MSSASSTNKLKALLNEQIPLTQAIGIEVVEEGENHLSLRAPLAKNINHKSTAFGGSLYCVAVLTGWGLVHQLMQRHGLHGHIVIQNSECDYLLPVDGDLISYCAFESEEQVKRFLNMYQRKGRARLKLVVKITHKGRMATRFTGSYVVHQ